MFGAPTVDRVAGQSPRGAYLDFDRLPGDTPASGTPARGPVSRPFGPGQSPAAHRRRARRPRRRAGGELRRNRSQSKATTRVGAFLSRRRIPAPVLAMLLAVAGIAWFAWPPVRRAVASAVRCGSAIRGPPRRDRHPLSRPGPHRQRQHWPCPSRYASHHRAWLHQGVSADGEAGAADRTRA